MKSETASDSKSKYHRHCSRCGWGFTREAWIRSAYCSSCGEKLHHGESRRAEPAHAARQGSRNAPSQKAAMARHASARGFRCYGCGKVIAPEVRSRIRECPDCGRQFTHAKGPSPRRPSVVREVCSGTVTPQARLSRFAVSLPQRTKAALATAEKHPFPSAVGTGLVGAGMIIGGQAITALGTTLMTVGGAIALLNGVGMAVAMGKGEKHYGKVQGKGMGIGMNIMLLGTGMAVGGQVISASGCGVAGSAVVLTGYGVAKEVRARRHRHLLEGAESGSGVPVLSDSYVKQEVGS